MVTPTGLPYIGKIHDNLGVAIGGNGHSAKCSYEIGHIATEMMTAPKWNYKLPPNAFQIIFEDINSNILKSKM